MRVCPKCGKQNTEDAVYCAYCATPFPVSSAIGTQPTVASTTQPQTDVKPIAVVGIIFAFVSLLFFPPLFGILAIILGAYALSKASEEQKSLAMMTIVLGAVFMVIGIFLGMLTVFMW